jgi:hypothetical protein
MASAATVNAGVSDCVLDRFAGASRQSRAWCVPITRADRACPDTFEYIGYLCNGTKESGVFRVPACYFDTFAARPLFIGLRMEPLNTLLNIDRSNVQVMNLRESVTLFDIASSLTDDLYNTICSYGRTNSSKNAASHASDESIYLPMEWASMWRSKVVNKLKGTSFLGAK